MGVQATTIQGLDRGTIRLLRRPALAPPFAAVKKIPKRCILLCVMVSGGGSSRAAPSRISGSRSNSGSSHGGGGRGMRVRAIRIVPEF